MSVATNNVFVYNPKSEVTSTMMRNGTNTYGYDWAGNRTSAVTNSLYGVAYTPNEFDQYANVNGVSPTYDADGNLTAIPGTCSMAYDGRNQMTFYSNANDRVWSTYDHQGRRIVKAVSGSTDTATRFLYDDWNLLAEMGEDDVVSYLWGLDLSGTEQGAGGIGGLLATFRNGDWYIPLADANGNVTEYINSSGSTVAHYEYDAFGNTLAQTGLMSGDFKFRFSTKYFDAESGLYYYGLRYYDPSWGRWLNRDPIGEAGGLNLYGFCGNDAIDHLDFLGAAWMLPYSTLEDLVVNALQEAMNKAAQTSKIRWSRNEFGGSLYFYKGFYYQSDFFEGTPTECQISWPTKVPAAHQKDAIALGTFHVHTQPSQNNENFSIKTDLPQFSGLRKKIQCKLVHWLGTPKGRIMKYDEDNFKEGLYGKIIVSVEFKPVGTLTVN